MGVADAVPVAKAPMAHAAESASSPAHSGVEIRR
jgi:hypothetical protein